MKSIIEFDYQKATQAINYLATKSKNQKINKMKAIKLIWLADRYHLRKYGRPIIGDVYFAMPYGPVGSSVKDIADSTTFLAQEEAEYSGKYIRKTDQYVTSLLPPDLDVFSQTDVEALTFVLENFGKYDRFELAEMSHEYPEWSKFGNQFKSKTTTREKMSYIDFFDDPDTEISGGDKFAKDKDQLLNAKDTFKEQYQLANDWM